MNGDTSQEVCPWNVRFSRELPEASPYAPREALLESPPSPLGPRLKDARTLAREILSMTQEEFSHAFSKSPLKRAKLRGLKRNAAVVLGNTGTSEDVGLLERVRDEEPDEMVREHAARALGRLTSASVTAAHCGQDRVGPDASELEGSGSAPFDVEAGPRRPPQSLRRPAGVPSDQLPTPTRNTRRGGSPSIREGWCDEKNQ